ncbi:MAG: hypothetical protein VX730_05815 [Pseudomonadota bacterium]|nr:hypothetical protein [Pseudomonadota bacterium]
MKRFIVALMFTALFSGQAFALSCMRPNAFWSAKHLNDQEDDFIVFKGSLTLEEPIDGPGYENPPKPKKTIGQTEGINLLTGEPFNERIAVQQHCYGPWCGTSSNKVIQDRLIYIRKQGENYSIELNPCGGVIFAQLKAEEEEKLIQCIKEKSCERPEPNYN